MKTFLCSILCFIALLITLSGCQKAKKPESDLSFPIKIAKATVANVPQTLNSFGTLLPPNTVDLKAQVSGEIINVPFKEGDFVKKGDLLVSIDPSPFLANLQTAKSQVLSAQAQATFARESYNSYKQLRDQDFISVIDLANYLRTMEVADASVLGYLGSLENARINLGYTQITAPIDGVIGFMGYQEGNIANTTDMLVSLVQVKPLYVVFSLSEQDLWSLREAQKTGPVKVSGSFLAKDRPSLQGTLHAIDNSVDTKTGTIMVKASFPNESLEAWPGEFVKVNLLLKTLPSLVVIDKAALQYGQQGPFVYVVDQTMHVTIRPVTLGPNYGDQISVMQGIKDGETVVTDGQLNLYPGAKVYVAK